MTNKTLRAGDILTPTEHAAIGDAAPHHAAVTLDANADSLFSLSTQEVGLNTQAANVVLAGPASGADAAPTFRALSAADMPVESPILRLLSADPASPVDGEAWVRKTPTAVGTPIGLLLALTHTLYKRELSVYDGGAVYRTELTIGV